MKKIYMSVMEDEALDMVQWIEKIIFLQRLEDPFEILERLKKQILSQVTIGSARMGNDMRKNYGQAKKKKKGPKPASHQNGIGEDGEDQQA